MALHYKGGVPSTIDADRLRNILDLSPADRRQIAAQLARSNPKGWNPQGEEQDFYHGLRGLIASRDGVETYETAARTVGGQQRHDRLSLRIRLERALAYKINEVVGRDAFLALASELPGQRRALRERLRQAKLWGALAELLWADLLARRDTEGVFEAIRAIPEIQPLLEEVTRSAGDGPEPEPEASDKPAEPWATSMRLALPDAPKGDWPDFVAELQGRITELQRERLDLDAARAVLTLALGLVESGERAEAAELAERRQAFGAIVDACKALAGEGVLADSIAKAEGLVAEVALRGDRFQLWTSELGDALAQLKQAATEKHEAQQAFRRASDDAIEDIPRLEATLSALKRARARAAAGAERLNTLLEQPPEPGTAPAAQPTAVAV